MRHGPKRGVASLTTSKCFTIGSVVIPIWVISVRKNSSTGGEWRLNHLSTKLGEDHTARAIDKALKAAGIPKHAVGGKSDFHACRVAYIDLVIESEVSVKEAQELARHATPDLTMNVYGRAREERLGEAVERVGEAVLPAERVPAQSRQVGGAETESATLIEAEGCARSKMVEAASTTFSS